MLVKGGKQVRKKEVGEERREGGRGGEGRVDMLPGYDKQHTTDTQVSQQNIHPDIGRKGVEEGENPGVGAVGLAVQDTYPQRHEGL